MGLVILEWTIAFVSGSAFINNHKERTKKVGDEPRISIPVI